MKYFFILLILPVFFACQNAAQDLETDDSNTDQETSSVATPDYAVALKFINDYADEIYNGTSGLSVDKWLAERKDLSPSFKSEYKRIVEEGLKADPEMGLGFDPILDAQDLPSSFEIEREEDEFLVVRGKDWPEFLLTLKLKHVGKDWLVDGSGIINIPDSRQMKR